MIAIRLEAGHDGTRHARELVRRVARIVRNALTEAGPGRVDVAPVSLIVIASFRRDPRKAVVELRDEGLALDLLVLAPALEDSLRLIEITEQPLDVPEVSPGADVPRIHGQHAFVLITNDHGDVSLQRRPLTPQHLERAGEVVLRHVGRRIELDRAVQVEDRTARLDDLPVNVQEP